MFDDRNDLVYQVLSVLITLLATLVLPPLRKWMQAKFTIEQLAAGRDVARIVVKAVEQTAIAVHGEGKLLAALDQAKAYASKYGLQFTDDQWKALLEQAVADMNDHAQLFGVPLPPTNKRSTARAVPIPTTKT